MDLGTRTLPGPGAAAQTLSDRRGTGTYCPLLRPELSGRPGLSAQGAAWEDKAVGGSMGRPPQHWPHVLASPLSPGLTLALNAMSLRTISSVKMMVKATLRMSEMWFICSDWL